VERVCDAQLFFFKFTAGQNSQELILEIENYLGCRRNYGVREEASQELLYNVFYWPQPKVNFSFRVSLFQFFSHEGFYLQIDILKTMASHSKS